MSNQLRFNGKSIEEALAKARTALGEGVRLVAAERVSKPGFVGKRISFTVVVEPPTAPISAPGFAAALRNVLVSAGPRPLGPADADESDYRSVQDELARTYGRSSTTTASSPTPPISAPMSTPKVFRRDGKVTKLTNIAAPSWATLADPVMVPPNEAQPEHPVTLTTSEASDTRLMPARLVVDTPGAQGAEQMDLAQMDAGHANVDTPLTETELVQAARRAMEAGSAPGAFLVDRIDALVVDLAGDAPVVDLRGHPFMAETAQFGGVTQLVAVVVPSATDPIGRFTEICEELGIVPAHRFVLARRRREIPAQMLSSANAVARSVMDCTESSGRTGVLVDPGQLRLLRGSFLDSMMAVVVAVEGGATVARLEREMSPCGEIDALWYHGDDMIAAKLGIARLRPSTTGADR